ncbi:MAG: menaquinone biosynthetic enzyme MqnA/MqnD family protein [Phycisphaerales bacterium]
MTPTDANTTLAEPAAPLRLGCVGYLNTLPLIEGLGKLRDLRLTLTAPARLSDLLQAGDIDMGLLSTIDYQRLSTPDSRTNAIPGGLCMIPVGMIGCDGPTLTVRLFSAVPWPDVTRLHADIDSHTSVALARIILAERFGVRPEIVEFDTELTHANRANHADSPQSMLLIGDKVVTNTPTPERYPYQLDLGEAWKALTGLPFVYAVWMCPAHRADDPRITAVSAVLDRQRRHNATRASWIIQQRAEVRGWRTDLAHHYTNDLLRFNVEEEHRRAVETFFDAAQRHAIIKSRVPTRWLDFA